MVLILLCLCLFHLIGFLFDAFIIFCVLLMFFFQTLSSWATCSVEEVASTGPGIRFFQLYVSFWSSTCSFDFRLWDRLLLLLIQVYKDRNVVRQLVKRAEEAGFKAIALTVDTPRLGRRESDIKNRWWNFTPWPSHQTNLFVRSFGCLLMVIILQICASSRSYVEELRRVGSWENRQGHKTYNKLESI